MTLSGDVGTQASDRRHRAEVFLLLTLSSNQVKMAAAARSTTGMSAKCTNCTNCVTERDALAVAQKGPEPSGKLGSGPGSPGRVASPTWAGMDPPGVQSRSTIHHQRTRAAKNSALASVSRRGRFLRLWRDAPSCGPCSQSGSPDGGSGSVLACSSPFAGMEGMPPLQGPRNGDGVPGDWTPKNMSLGRSGPSKAARGDVHARTLRDPSRGMPPATPSASHASGKIGKYSPVPRMRNQPSEQGKSIRKVHRQRPRHRVVISLTEHSDRNKHEPYRPVRTKSVTECIRSVNAS